MVVRVSWRRYTREVCWYVRAYTCRKAQVLRGPKLVSRLKGPRQTLGYELDHHGVLTTSTVSETCYKRFGDLAH